MRLKFGAVVGVVFGCLAIGAAELPVERAEVRSIGPGGGGYLVALTASRHHPERLYVGCDVGGFYRSDDRGRHYRILNAGLDNMFVNDIAEHPTDPERLLIATRGGISLSRDGGLTWISCRPKAKGLPKPSPYAVTWPIKAISWDEAKPTRVWAVTGDFGRAQTAKPRAHVWVSEDAGESWRRATAADDPLAELPTQGIALSAHSARDGELLMTTVGGVWLSEDAGAHWRKSMDGLPADGVMQVRHVARAASRPDTVYLSMRQQKAVEGKTWRSGVFRSDDGGRTWCACRQPAGLKAPGKELTAASSVFWNEATMAPDPRDPETVWTSSSTWFRHSGVWKSTDGGGTWTQCFKGPMPGWLNFWNGAARPLTVSRSDPDFVAYGTSGQIMATEDGGTTWRQRYTANDAREPIAGTGLEVTCVRMTRPDLAVKDRWYIGFWDIALLISEDGGRTMTRSVDGVPRDCLNSCFTLVQDPTHPDRLYATFGNWAPPRSIFCVSEDRGRHWRVATNGWHSTSVVNRLAFLPKAGVLAASGEHSWNRADAWRGVMLSRDGGNTWTDVTSNAFPQVGRALSVFAHEDVLYAGTAVSGDKVSGALWESEDNGVTWRNLTESVPGPIGSVASVAFRGDTIAFAADRPHYNEKGGGCYVSRDRGKTWKTAYVANGCRSVCFAGDRLVLAIPTASWRDPGFGGEGVHVSRDFGETWTHVVGEGFDRAQVIAVEANPWNEREIWCSTSGNAAFVLTLLR